MFTGSPGAGKTSSLVDYLSKLEGNRPLFVDGLNGLKLPHTEIDSTLWPSLVPDGAILVIDEAQRIWRPRGSGSKVPDHVAALETHRHRGIDVFFTTQAPALIDSNVRNLVGRHVHIRDTGIMGRYWYEWPETSTGMVWKTCINKKKISLPKKAFELYTSSSLHIKPVRGVPRILLVVILLLLCSLAMVYGVYKMISRFSTPVALSVPVALPSAVPSAFPAAGVPALALNQRPAIDDRVDFIPRISNRPESAPAYDNLRVVVVMPTVTGAACVNGVCKCFNVQGTDAGLTLDECATWAKSPPFNPYLAEKIEGNSPKIERPGSGQAQTMTTSGVSLAAPV